ncbi:unnamed protein product, partial [Urochloa humidicola]
TPLRLSSSRRRSRQWRSPAVRDVSTLRCSRPRRIRITKQPQAASPSVPLSAPPPFMAHPLLSASPRFRLAAAAAGNGVPRLSVTSSRPTARASRRNARPRALSVRCEQGAKGGGGGLDVWLSRGAMLGFVGVVAVELTTGKGVLENVGLTAPLPTVALALTGVVGIFTAFIIFQSGTQD